MVVCYATVHPLGLWALWTSPVLIKSLSQDITKQSEHHLITEQYPQNSLSWTSKMALKDGEIKDHLLSSALEMIKNFVCDILFYRGSENKCKGFVWYSRYLHLVVSSKVKTTQCEQRGQALSFITTWILRGDLTSSVLLPGCYGPDHITSVPPQEIYLSQAVFLFFFTPNFFSAFSH